jgi:hypothetical protein
METKEFNRFRKFALNFVKPLLSKLDIKKDFIDISTFYEGRRVIFNVEGVVEDGSDKWEIVEVFEPNKENFKIITQYV